MGLSSKMDYGSLRDHLLQISQTELQTNIKDDKITSEWQNITNCVTNYLFLDCLMYHVKCISTKLLSFGNQAEINNNKKKLYELNRAL